MDLKTYFIQQLHQYDLNVGNIIISGLLTVIGWGLRKTYFVIFKFIKKVDNYDSRIENIAERSDTHSSILIKAGWVKGMELDPVSQKRRHGDYTTEDV